MAAEHGHPDVVSEAADRQKLQQQIELHRAHPAVHSWYRRIHLFECPMPEIGYFCFVGAVFQYGLHGNVVWCEGEQAWGMSGWLPLSEDDAFERSLIRVRPAANGRTFAELLDLTVTLQRDLPAPGKPWWRFW